MSRGCDASSGMLSPKMKLWKGVGDTKSAPEIVGGGRDEGTAAVEGRTASWLPCLRCASQS